MDERIAAVAKVAISGDVPNLTSWEVLSVITGVPRQSLPQLFTRCAAVINHLSASRVWRMERMLASSFRRVDLIHHIEFVQYDETPLPTRLTGDPAGAQEIASYRRGGQLALADGPANSGAICQIAATGALGVRQGQGHQKIVQTRKHTAVVVRLGEQLATLAYEGPARLSVIESATADVLKRQQLSVSETTRIAAIFQGHTRAATTDAHPSNICVESSISRDRSAVGCGCPSLHLLCEVHKTAGIYKKTFAPLDSRITGVIRCALSMRTAGGMSVFRSCMREEIASRIEVLDGHPPLAARVYKMCLLKVFASQGSCATTRRALLSLCPNGDWRSNNIEFYLRDSDTFSRADTGAIVKHVTNGLTVALAAATPHLYNRSKWTGADVAVDDLAVLEGVHRLLSTTIARFSARYVGGARRDQLLQWGYRSRAYDREQLLELEAEARGPHGEEQPAGGEQVEREAGREPTGDAMGTAELAALNAKNREAALRFLSDNPMAWLVVLRLLMEPLRQLLCMQFSRAGDAKAFAKKAAAAAAAMAGNEPDLTTRLGEVASGVDDRKFFEQVVLMMRGKALWQLLPPSVQNFEMRATVWKAASRMGCAFVKSMVTPHDGFPLKLFRLLREPDLAAEFGRKQCLMDPWTLRLHQRFEGFTSAEFFQILYTVGRFMPVDISHVESLHATVRRLLFTRSVQTHAMGLPDLSAQWVCQQYRRSKKHLGKAKAGHSKKLLSRRARAKRKAGKPRCDKPDRPKQRAGFGGPWRAWIRKKMKSLKTHGREVKQSYHIAKRENTAEYRDAVAAGSEATKAGRTRGSGFGKKRSAVLRTASAASRAYRALLARVPDDDVAERSFMLAQHSHATGATVAQTLSVSRAGQREAAVRARLAEGENAATLSKYQKEIGDSVLGAVRQMCPALAHLPMSAEASPHGVFLIASKPTDEDILCAWEWAAANSQSSALATRLDTYWDLSHRPIADHGVEAPEVPAPSPCYKAGICICSDSGPELQARAKRFSNYIKQACPIRSDMRERLVNGQLVAKVTNGVQIDPDDLLAVAAQGENELWFHFGHMTLAPFQPGMLQVEPVESLTEVGESPHRVYLRSKRWASWRKLLEPFAQCDQLFCQWYQLEETSRPVADFAPEPLPALRLPAFVEPERFWPRRVARRRAPGEEAPLAVCDDPEAAAELDVDSEPSVGDEEDEVEPEMEAEGLLDEAFAAYEDIVAAGGAVGDVVPGGDDPDLAGGAGGDEPAGGAIPEEAVGRAVCPLAIRAAARPRGECMVAVMGGYITYYASNQNYQATCLSHVGERCTLTASAERDEDQRLPAAWRPLGLLLLWLSIGDACDCKVLHKGPDKLKELAGPTHRAWRLGLRREFSFMPGAAELSQYERDPYPDEGDEPEWVPPYRPPR